MDDLSQFFHTTPVPSQVVSPEPSPLPSHQMWQDNPYDTWDDQLAEFIVQDSQPNQPVTFSPLSMPPEQPTSPGLFVSQPAEDEDVGSQSDELGLVDPLDEVAGGRFRLAAKSVFLTYPKCTLDKDIFVAAIDKFKFEHYYAVREDHKDGTPHYHVIGEWSTKKNIKNPRFFDIQKFHPNIGRTRNRLAAWRYLHKTKGRSVHVGGDMPEPQGLKREVKDEFWKEIVNVKDRRHFISRFREEAPRDLILHYSNIRAYADDEFKVDVPEYTTPKLSGIWDLPDSITEWVEDNLHTKQG